MFLLNPLIARGMIERILSKVHSIVLVALLVAILEVQPSTICIEVPVLTPAPAPLLIIGKALFLLAIIDCRQLLVFEKVAKNLSPMEGQRQLLLL